MLAALTAILLVVSVVASWTSGTALNTEKFVKRISPVIDEPAVRMAVATELGNELVGVLNVQDRLSPVLPTNLQFLSAALATGVERVVREQVAKAVDGDAFRKISVAALTLSHQQVVTTLTGRAHHVRSTTGRSTSTSSTSSSSSCRTCRTSCPQSSVPRWPSTSRTT